MNAREAKDGINFGKEEEGRCRRYRAAWLLSGMFKNYAGLALGSEKILAALAARPVWFSPAQST